MPPGNRPGVPCTRGRVCFGVDVDGSAKISTPLGFEDQAVQPVGGRHTNYDTAALVTTGVSWHLNGCQIWRAYQLQQHVDGDDNHDDTDDDSVTPSLFRTTRCQELTTTYLWVRKNKDYIYVQHHYLVTRLVNLPPFKPIHKLQSEESQWLA